MPRATGRVLMVDHLLEYHPGVDKLKEIVDSGELGDIHYIYGNRLNLGKLRADENALWSLGAHDVSVMLYLAGGEEPTELAARGECYMRDGIEMATTLDPNSQGGGLFGCGQLLPAQEVPEGGGHHWPAPGRTAPR